MEQWLPTRTDPPCHLPVARAPELPSAGGAALPPESLWRLLQQTPHLVPRTPRPQVRELDE